MRAIRFICSSGLLFLPLTVSAQNRAVPVTVTVSVLDGDKRVQPLRYVIFFIPERGGEWGDYLAAQTDWEGRAELTLRPGRYRIQSAAPLRLTSIEYHWDIPYTVEQAERLQLSLTEANARTSPPIRPPVRPGQIVARPVPFPPDSQQVPPEERSQPEDQAPTAAPPELSLGQQGYRDPGTARLLALLPGAGHIYSGETLKGAGLLLGGAALLGTGIALLTSCDEPAEDCAQEDRLAGLSFAGAAGVAIYSIVDAAAAARRSNRRNAPRIVGFLRPEGTQAMSAGLRWSF